MASRALFRPLTVATRAATRRPAPTRSIRQVRPLQQHRAFQTTRPALIRVGDVLPNLEVLHEGTPGTRVNLAKEVEDKDAVIIGVPAAFSGACSSTHIPSYINHPAIKDFGLVAVVSVNDVFV